MTTFLINIYFEQYMIDFYNFFLTKHQSTGFQKLHGTF